MKAEQESAQQKPAYNQGSDCGPKPGCPATQPALNLKKHNSAAEPFFLSRSRSFLHQLLPAFESGAGREARTQGG